MRKRTRLIWLPETISTLSVCWLREGGRGGWVSAWQQGSNSILRRRLIGQHFRRHEAGSKWLHMLTETQERLMGPKHHWTMAIFCVLPFALQGLVQKTPSESHSGPANRVRLPNVPFCTTCTKTMREMARERERYSRAWYNNCLLEEISLWTVLMEQFKCTLGQTFA